MFKLFIWFCFMWGMVVMQPQPVPTGGAAQSFQGQQGPPATNGPVPPFQGQQGPPVQGQQGPPFPGQQGPPIPGQQGPPFPGQQGPPAPTGGPMFAARPATPGPKRRPNTGGPRPRRPTAGPRRPAARPPTPGPQRRPNGGNTRMPKIWPTVPGVKRKKLEASRVSDGSDTCSDIWSEGKCLDKAGFCGSDVKAMKINCKKTCNLCGWDGKTAANLAKPWFKCDNKWGEGYCEKHKNTVCTKHASRCIKMCGKCPVKPKFPPGLKTCKDILPDCHLHKRKIYCKSDPDIIRNKCWKTCGFCESSTVRATVNKREAVNQRSFDRKRKRTVKSYEQVTAQSGYAEVIGVVHPYGKKVTDRRWLKCTSNLNGDQKCERKKDTVCKTQLGRQGCRKTCIIRVCRVTPPKFPPGLNTCKDILPAADCLRKKVWCRSDSAHVRNKCWKTCGFCDFMGPNYQYPSSSANGGSAPQSAPAQANCNDIWPNCKGWTHMCKNTPQVQTNCKKTCNLCSLRTLRATVNKREAVNQRSFDRKRKRTVKSYEQVTAQSGYAEVIGVVHPYGNKVTDRRWLRCTSNLNGDKKCESKKDTVCKTQFGRQGCRKTCIIRVCRVTPPKFPPGLNTCKDILPAADCLRDKVMCRADSAHVRNKCWKTCGFCDFMGPNYKYPSSGSSSANHGSAPGPQSAPAQANCNDIWPNCKGWTHMCKNTPQVQTNCKKTCNLCSLRTVRAAVNKRASLKNSNMPGPGEPVAPPAPDCKDDWSTCAYIKKSRKLDCEKNPSVMRNCQFTCGLCKSHQENYS